VLWKLPEIRLSVETLFNIGPYPVSNTLLMTWLAILIIIVFGIVSTRNMQLIPGPVQNFVEWSIEALLGLCESVAGRTRGRKFFPLVASIFFFVLLCNYMELIPGVDSIGAQQAGAHAVFGVFLLGNNSNKLIPWVRPPSSDLNMTIGLALVSVIVTQWYGFVTLGARAHLSHYINFKNGPIGIFVGLLEIISELGRIISFSFRLFGNIFGGDVLLIVIAFLIPFAGPILFYFLEAFVGFIQAIVFAGLTLIFLTLATTHSGEHGAGAVSQEEAQAARAEEVASAL
jgi:F-type H+-transporting ATPase subunit a